LAGRGTPGTFPGTINAGGTLTGAPSLVNGTSTHLQGLLTMNGGLLAHSGTSSNGANGRWGPDGGGRTDGGPGASVITALSVVPSQSGGTLFNVVAPISTAPPSGVDMDITGTLTHATGQPDTGINMTGSGTLRLSNTNSYTGGTTFSAGVVIVNAPE